MGNHGEWQEERNQWGGVRRFRWIAPGVKEYEMDVFVDGIPVPQSQVEDYNRRKKEAEAARRAAPPPPPARQCPFSFTGVPGDCKRDNCALFDGEACALAQIADKAARDTAGKSCPLNPYKCEARCALYKSGCVVTAMNERNIDMNTIYAEVNQIAHEAFKELEAAKTKKDKAIVCAKIRDGGEYHEKMLALRGKVVSDSLSTFDSLVSYFANCADDPTLIEKWDILA